MKLLINVKTGSIEDRVRLVNLLDYLYDNEDDKWWVEGWTGIVRIDDEQESEALRDTLRMYDFMPESYMHICQD